MTTLVIGGGCLGMFITDELLKKNEKVHLITKTFHGSGWEYSVGYQTSPPDPTYKSMFLTNNYNILWPFLYFFIHHNKEYMRYKKKYVTVNHQTKCKDTIYFDTQRTLTELLNRFKRSPNFSYEVGTVDLENLKPLSKKYKNIYVCVGNASKETMYNQNIGAYRIDAESNQNDSCMHYDCGFLIWKKNGVLHVQNSHIFGKDKMPDDKVVQTGTFLLEKYGATKILDIHQSKRSVSLDSIPFYFNEGNIVHVRGGSYVACGTAPSVAQAVVNRDKFFHISRIKHKITNFVIKLVVVLMVIYRLKKHKTVYKN